MTDDLDKQTRIERHKTIRMGLMVVALLIVAAVLFGVYRFVTAPVRVAQDTTQTITRTVEETATAVLTRRHIEVREGRKFSRLADAAHAALTALPETRPAGLGERAFRLAHLRGSQNKVCRFTMDFGAGPVPVWTAADNADFEANRRMGGEAERQLRIVWETEPDILGVSVQYAAQYDRNDDAPRWELLWRRRDSLSKPMTDALMSERTMNALAAIPEQCGTPAP
ncbi:hypothetical protein ACFFUB_10020 [Algimonas porphyrae]|uniref:Uncharacterized protein n=1 Tax=Algimonas porphyrae TaxID=1128113 RepID=A0ABQ5V1X3_9PROT|nr:hypothetical protein [Algimonas porphyrae]GLQ21551.1 hypothetical protein GCM10007854_25060 [Algimonas porphyrae]